MFGLRIAIPPEDGEEDKDDTCMTSRTEDEGEDPMLSFRNREMARPDWGDCAPANSPVASWRGGWIGLCAAGLLDVLGGNMNCSATFAVDCPERARAIGLGLLGGERAALLDGESRCFVSVGTNWRSWEMKREDNTDSNSSSWNSGVER